MRTAALRTRGPGRRRAASGWGRALLGILVLVGASCRATDRLAPAPIPSEATDLVFAADDALRARPERVDEARAALERARSLAPDWIAPRRMLDEIARGELSGVDVLRAHRAELARDPLDAGVLYLAGRLEGPAGVRRFEAAVSAAPESSFAHHGLAYSAAGRGRLDDAVAEGRRALEHARDPWERTFFTTALARHLSAARRSEEALTLLDARAADPELRPSERAVLASSSVQIALGSEDRRLQSRAYERGLDVLRREPLCDADVEELVARMRASFTLDDPSKSRLSLALSALPGASRERLQAERLLEDSWTPLGLHAYERALARQGREAPTGSLVRAGRFAAGQFAEAVERWRRELPASVLDGAGVPRNEALARVVRAARRLAAESASTDVLRELGEALIAAGWFREARSVAVALSSTDLDGALSLENRGLSGVEALESLRRVMRRIDRAAADSSVRPRNDRNDRDDPRALRGATSVLASANPSSSTPALLSGADDAPVPRTLDALLDSFAATIAAADAFLGGETDPAVLRSRLRASPRLDYAGVAQVVHPGPVFSDEDQAAGRGVKGAAVGGVAEEFARIGRFVLCGELSGGGPDATVLPILSHEYRSGRYLGVPWHGTVVWCESADVRSRAGRQGASISAAALHEGFWVDVDSVREELAAWNVLRKRFEGGARERLDALLSSPGLALEDPRSLSERVSITALLSESQRVRLAVLRDRAAGDEPLGRMTLEELLEVTAAHEAGHLCDRTRFLPVWDHKLACLGLLFECGFRPQRVAEELEYRAQLTCIAVADDPRIPLAQVLDSAEAGPGGVTPHAAGYARLLSDLLRVMVDETSPIPGLDTGHTYAHQLHRLAPEEIRKLALALAEKKGMVP